MHYGRTSISMHTQTMVKIHPLFKDMVFINLLTSEFLNKLILPEEVNLIVISYV